MAFAVHECRRGTGERVRQNPGAFDTTFKMQNTPTSSDARIAKERTDTVTQGTTTGSETDHLTARVPVRMLTRIDERVEAGEFDSRSEAVRRGLDGLLDAQRGGA